MIYQNEAGIVEDAQHYSCLFNVIARAREFLAGRPWTVAQYNAAWLGAKEAGIISGDLNADGDFDDAGEDEILTYPRLIDFLEVPLVYVPRETFGLPITIDAGGAQRIAATISPLDPKKYWVAEKWIWRQGHFLQGDGTGLNPPIHDPIKGGSMTRARGKIESLRVFLIRG